MMSEIIYNKLVRDKIPSIIRKDEKTPITRNLDDIDYKKQLELKLNEEYHEVLEATGNDRLEELADMLEIMKYLAKLEGFSLDDIIDVANEKSLKRGAFDSKIFLEKIIESN